MLVVDPEKRLSIPQIFLHRWLIMVWYQVLCDHYE
jgi:hypothetical protein